MLQKAMTLIELLVSIAILSIMIAIFGSVLSSSQRVTSASHALMQTNAKVAAISEIIRADLRKLTQNGLLCIAEDAVGRPRLLFTTAGVSPSALGPEVGSGMIVCYGQANNQACDPASTNPADDVIWRQGWILKRGGTTTDDVRSAYDLADIQLMNRGQCHADVNTLVVGFAPHDTVPGHPKALFIPPRTPAELRGAWQCFAANCSDLEISWTDGTSNTDGNLNWFGEGNPKTLGPPPTFDAYNPNQGEYDHAGTYRILWTHHVENICPPHDPIITPCPRHDRTVWPHAIRIRFTLDGSPHEILYALP